MPGPDASSSSQLWFRVAVTAAVAFGTASCSNSSRFESNNTTPPSDVTGSISRSQPTSRVESTPLPAPSRPATVAATGVSGGAGGLGAYRPVPTTHSDITGSVTTTPVRPVPAPQPVVGWTWEGGTPIVVGHDETLEIIARRYGVPSAAIMQANGISSPSMVRPGQHLVIPRYQGASSAGITPPPAVAPIHIARPAPVAAPKQQTVDVIHTVAPGESLIKIAKMYGKSLDEVAKANSIQPYTKVNMGDRLTIPHVRQAMVTPPVVSAQAGVPQVAQPRTVPVATAEPVQNARMATPAQETPAPETTSKTAEAAGALPSFRWPVRGRVIAGFGPKPNGQQNDGINLAVPEGTPVKSTEDGVVAYAGNELKGYGNLVLIRHANGYVSAYAHASELMVKRGDTVKRGQVIAKSGQTGNVTSPQLHFEIRKGSAPVDPTQYLNGA
jgi:murein DD-endopeptidase MepM/ murein hydrolase activator NlpD